MIPFIRSLCLLLILGGLSARGTATAVEPFPVHPYHVSLTEVEWNPDTGNLEVAMQVWPADLEKGLAKHLERPVDLDREAELDARLADYLATRFSVRQGDRRLSIRWAGHERDLKQAWLYFEIVDVRPNDEFIMEQRLFHDLNEDQINHVNAQLGRSEVTRLQFTLNAPRQSLPWPNK